VAMDTEVMVPAPAKGTQEQWPHYDEGSVQDTGWMAARDREGGRSSHDSSGQSPQGRQQEI
jgi:hypothetical protein